METLGVRIPPTALIIMENKEFNLSEKIILYNYAIEVDDVKEFINKLKEEFRYSALFTGKFIIKEIDKLAGEELNGSK